MISIITKGVMELIKSKGVQAFINDKHNFITICGKKSESTAAIFFYDAGIIIHTYNEAGKKAMSIPIDYADPKMLDKVLKIACYTPSPKNYTKNSTTDTETPKLAQNQSN